MAVENLLTNRFPLAEKTALEVSHIKIQMLTKILGNRLDDIFVAGISGLSILYQFEIITESGC